MIAAALALSLAAAQPAPLAQALRLGDGGPLAQTARLGDGGPLAQTARLGDGAPLAQDEGEAPWDDDDVEKAPRLFLTVWGGEALDEAGRGQSSGILGGEVAWAFSSLDLGLAGYGYRQLAEADREWTPVALVRLAQRFRTRAGLEATFAIGLGAGRPDNWTAWYQVALGGRATFGPVFVAGELSFEQNDLLRLAAGLGLAF